MTEPYITTLANQTYDISIDLAGDKVSLIGLDNAEIMCFMSLMPKIFVTRYANNQKIPNWIMTLHQEKTDGNNDK